MKLLFLTDFPPCKEYTGGLVIDRLFNFVEPGQRYGFFIINPDIPVVPNPELDIVFERVDKPRESANRPTKDFRGELNAFREQTRQKLVNSKSLADMVQRFVEKHQIDAVWAIIEGQTIVRVTLELQRRLQIPIHVMVWDPIDWWLRANEIDVLTQIWVKMDFDRVIRSARSCATASWAMSEQYEKKYGVRCVPVISSIPAELAQPAAEALVNGKTFTIGLAGQLYALDEWKRLISSFESCDWNVDGLHIKMKLLGGFPSPVINDHIEYMGQQSQADAIKILSQLDSCFCPYPFSAEMRDVSNTSFPSKLTTYLAAGRPTLFHGPATSSPAKFIEKHRVGIVVGAESELDLISAVRTLICDQKMYRQLCKNSHSIFKEFFTVDKMRQAFNETLATAQ
jgi:glycosyltransferase involved in cell wall biosynthesis